MTLPTDSDIDIAVPVNGYPVRAKTNPLLKKLVSSSGSNASTLDSIQEVIDGDYVRLKPSFSAAAGSFPSATHKGEIYVSSDDGVIDGVRIFKDNSVVSIVDNPSTTTYEGNWILIGSGLESGEVLTYTINWQDGGSTNVSGNALVFNLPSSSTNILPAWNDLQEGWWRGFLNTHPVYSSVTCASGNAFQDTTTTATIPANAMAVVIRSPQSNTFIFKARTI